MEIDEKQLNSIGNELIRLGFLHIKDILPTIESASAKLQIPGVYFLHDRPSGLQKTEYTFAFVLGEHNHELQLQSLQAKQDVTSMRAAFMPFPITVSFSHHEAPIPPKYYIDEKLNDALRNHNQTEILYKDQRLRKEFKNIGFDLLHPTMEHRGTIGQYSHFRYIEETKAPVSGVTAEMTFDFTTGPVVKAGTYAPEEFIQLTDSRLISVQASLTLCPRQNREIPWLATDRIYTIGGEGLPNKNEMNQEAQYDLKRYAWFDVYKKDYLDKDTGQSTRSTDERSLSRLEYARGLMTIADGRRSTVRHHPGI